MQMPLATSLKQSPVHAKNGWVARGLLLGLLACPSGPAQAVVDGLPQVRFEAGRLEYAGISLDSVHGALDQQGRFSLGFSGWTGPGEAFVGDGLQLRGELESWSMEDSRNSATASVQALGLEARLELQAAPEGRQLRIALSNQDVLALAGLPALPAALQWLREGRFDAALDWRESGSGPAEPGYSFALRGLAFDSPEGRYAAEGLALQGQGKIRLATSTAFELRGAVEGGELLLGDFYRNFADGGLDYALRGEGHDGKLELTTLRLDDGGALLVDGALRYDTARPEDWAFDVHRLELAFPAAYGRYVEPVAAAWALDGLTLTGHVNWSGEWDGGRLISGDLEIGDFSAVDTRRERFAVTGLQAHLRPGDHSFESRLGWQGLLLGSINLGSGQARLDSEPGKVALVEPLRLDVLGGRLDLEQFSLILPGTRADGGDEPDIRVAARLDRLDMTRLTQALGWPSFGGTISGEIPGVSLDDGVLKVDGQIRFEVFDGEVTLEGLGIERPFGVLPSLAANIEVRDLDLQQLTSTFSFGRIAGRLDGHVGDLRMLDWQPVAFDAWLGTPERQTGSSDISRQAVNRLTAIGGGAPTAALASPLMRMFSNFSYRRLGLGCTLADNVCHLHGLSDDGEGVLILEGAGVPKITIRAFNRDIDWPQMVSNLVAISEGESVQVGGAPDS
jgi:hypothetical protein